MNNEELNKLKAIEINMLKEVIRICQKHELRYFVIGGTCLGAVRHNGFIPWDDDIDIGIPRNDYNKFLKIAQDELPSHLFLQNYKTEKDFILNFTKIRDNNTTFVEKFVAHLNINHGVYIDIFPLDGVPNNRFIRNINNLKITCLKLGMLGHYIDNTTGMRLPSRAIRYIIKALYKPYKLHEKIDSIVEKHEYDQCDLVKNYFGIWGEKEIIPRKYFGIGCILTFENISVTAPIDYDKFLTNIFGNYMTLPPKEKKVSHHHTVLIDLDNSYTLYKNHLDKLLD
jgi:lipopolysaccharide cholinephosphotransferase